MRGLGPVGHIARYDDDLRRVSLTVSVQAPLRFDMAHLAVLGHETVLGPPAHSGLDRFLKDPPDMLPVLGVDVLERVCAPAVGFPEDPPVVRISIEAFSLEVENGDQLIHVFQDEAQQAVIQQQLRGRNQFLQFEQNMRNQVFFKA